jgi:uncharacterized protein YciI
VRNCTPCDARTVRPVAVIVWQSNRTRTPRALATTLAIAKNSSRPALIHAEQPWKPKTAIRMSDFAINESSMTLPDFAAIGHCCSYSISRGMAMGDRASGTRRHFVSVTAAALSGAGLGAGAQEAKAADAPPTPGFLVIYRPGSGFLPDKPLSEQPLREHGRYMLGLFRQGILRMAGGFADNSGGAALIDVATIEEARAIADADPAVSSRVFVHQVHQWTLVDWAARVSGGR